MGALDDLYEPETEEAATKRAVSLILKAANYLCLASELSEEGVDVSAYVNAAVHLRDLVHSLSPEKPCWPSDGAAIYDLKTGKRVN